MHNRWLACSLVVSLVLAHAAIAAEPTHDTYLENVRFKIDLTGQGNDNSNTPSHPEWIKVSGGVLIIDQADESQDIPVDPGYKPLAPGQARVDPLILQGYLTDNRGNRILLEIGHCGPFEAVTCINFSSPVLPQSFADWLGTVVAGKPTRHRITITLIPPDKRPSVSWMFFDAFPVKWEGPSLDSDSPKDDSPNDDSTKLRVSAGKILIRF